MEFTQTTINGHDVQIYKTYHGTELYISNPEGENIYAHKVSGDPIQRAKEIIGANRLPEAVQTAFHTLFAGTFLMDEAEAAKTQTALAKAMDELEANDSIKFDGTRLTFVSRSSGEQRNVTKFGCFQTCVCKAKVSYHSAMFAILAAAHGSNVVRGAFGGRREQFRQAA